MKVIEMLKSFWHDEDGGEIVEYAIVIGILVVGVAAIVVTIQQGAGEKFEEINKAVHSG